MILEDDVADEVRSLERLDLEGLRTEWRRRFGAPPKLRSPGLLRYMIAWRLQTATLGDLEPSLKRELRRPATSARQAPALTPGSVLKREWLGRMHQVEVTEQGFIYGGKAYASLSSAAGAITGGKWNGRRFFALDRA